MNAIDVERRIGAVILFCRTTELYDWMAFFILFLIAFVRLFERVASEVCR
jgi:hypothetical protein